MYTEEFITTEEEKTAIQESALIFAKEIER